MLMILVGWLLLGHVPMVLAAGPPHDVNGRLVETTTTSTTSTTLP